MTRPMTSEKIPAIWRDRVNSVHDEVWPKFRSDFYLDTLNNKTLYRLHTYVRKLGEDKRYWLIPVLLEHITESTTTPAAIFQQFVSEVYSVQLLYKPGNVVDFHGNEVIFRDRDQHNSEADRLRLSCSLPMKEDELK